MKENYKDMIVRYMSGKPGVHYTDGKLVLDNVSEKAVIRFEGNTIVIDFSSLHPKKSAGQEVLLPENYEDALNAVNGIYAQIFPIEL